MTKKELLGKMKMEEDRINYLFKNKVMPKYQDMLWISFAFGTGLNHECDDVIYALRKEIDYCLGKLEVIFKQKFTSQNLLRIVGNYNGNNAAFLLHFFAANFSDRHALIITSKEMYLIKNATDKAYLFLLNNGNPLVTFASSRNENARGVFDGKHIYFGEEINSSLPEKLNLKITENGYESRCFFGEKKLTVNGKEIQKIATKKNAGVNIVEF